jgi:hypothetical protein
MQGSNPNEMQSKLLIFSSNAAILQHISYFVSLGFIFFQSGFLCARENIRHFNFAKLFVWHSFPEVPGINVRNVFQAIGKQNKVSRLPASIQR